MSSTSDLFMVDLSQISTGDSENLIYAFLPMFSKPGVYGNAQHEKHADLSCSFMVHWYN